jgi:nucleotidyltransferase/DNA polymerase involved in DNA repair
MDFIRNLPIRKVPGVGRVSERVLESVGVHVRVPAMISGL